METKRALLVDDDQQWFTVCTLMCRAFGYDCTWAKDPATARNCLRRASYNVLILDLGFPDREGNLFPPEVDEVDLFVVELIFNSALPILVCTGLSDRTKVALVKERLATAQHRAYFYRKGEDLQELYRGFSFVTGKAPDSGPPTPVAIGPVLGAFAGLLTLHFSLLVSLFLAPHYLPKDSGPQLTYFLMALIAFTGSVSTLLLFWGVNAVTKQDVAQVLNEVISSLMWSSRSGRPASASIDKPPARRAARQ